jgi:cold shock CspA family protein
VQGVIKMFDTLTNEGVLVSDADRAEFVLAPGALDGSVFRMLRQGQRVNFDVDNDGRATRIRSGAEPDLGLPTAQV